MGDKGEGSPDRQGLVVEVMLQTSLSGSWGATGGVTEGWHSYTAVSDHPTPLPGLPGEVTGAQGGVAPLALGTEGGHRGLLGSSMCLAACAKSASQSVGLRRWNSQRSYLRAQVRSKDRGSGRSAVTELNPERTPPVSLGADGQGKADGWLVEVPPGS